MIQALQELERLSDQIQSGCTAPHALELLSNVGHLSKSSGLAEIAAAAEKLADAALDSGPKKAKETISAGLAALREALQTASGGKLRTEPTPSPGASTSPADSEHSAISQDPELIADFITESREHLAAIEEHVLLLENDPSSMDSLHAAFRSFHTIKGLAGFLELTDIREVSHQVETLMDRARNQQITVTPEVIDVVLEGSDYLKRAVDWVESTLNGKQAVPPPIEALLQRVRTVGSGQGSENRPTTTEQRDDAQRTATSADKTETPNQTLRVDAAKLDALIDMVGELMISQSLVMHAPELQNVRDAGLMRNLQQLRRITNELQRISMGLRMAPVVQLFGRMTRVVRDLSRKNGKAVRLECSGEETELDKAIIEQLADPLMHMVRNSLDHGLEPPDERAAAGKSTEGTLKLSAYQQAGQIVIEVSDDGRGLNKERILKTARERGLVNAAQSLTDSEIFHLIFEPGFSTAEKVTDISGRGVGMDVVRKQIQSLRGRVDIHSSPGQGTTFFLKLPLTLAIVEGLIVNVGEEHYVIPVATVQEMVRPTREMLFTMEGRVEMAMVRDSVLPIVRLDQRFEVPRAKQNPCEGLLIVVNTGGRAVCVLVDSLVGKQEVVIKSLGEIFQGTPGVSGGAILGDGRVGLILDMNGIVREPAHA